MLHVKSSFCVFLTDLYLRLMAFHSYYSCMSCISRVKQQHTALLLYLNLAMQKFSINVISSNQNPRQGRHILWAWLQERRKVGSYDYAGCMCVPRLIYKKGDRLFQEPAPEMAGLRRGEAWQAKSFELESAQPMALNAISGPAVEIQVTFERWALFLKLFSSYWTSGK